MLGYSHDTNPQRVRFRTRIVPRVTSGASSCREMLKKRYAGSVVLFRSSLCSGQHIIFCVPLISMLYECSGMSFICSDIFFCIAANCSFRFSVSHFLQEAAYLFFIVPFAYFPHPIGNRSTQMRFHPSLIFSLSGSAWIVSP